MRRAVVRRRLSRQPTDAQLRRRRLERVRQLFGGAHTDFAVDDALLFRFASRAFVPTTAILRQPCGGGTQTQTRVVTVRAEQRRHTLTRTHPHGLLSSALADVLVRGVPDVDAKSAVQHAIVRVGREKTRAARFLFFHSFVAQCQLSGWSPWSACGACVNGVGLVSDRRTIAAKRTRTHLRRSVLEIARARCRHAARRHRHMSRFAALSFSFARSFVRSVSLCGWRKAR